MINVQLFLLPFSWMLVLNNQMERKRKNSFQRLLRRIFSFIPKLNGMKQFFRADLKVPVCRVMYAWALWSTSDNNSWELFTLFWNASKRCQSFLCFRVPLCSAGSRVPDDRSSVLGVSFSSQSPAAKHPNYQRQTRGLPRPVPSPSIYYNAH